MDAEAVYQLRRVPVCHLRASVALALAWLTLCIAPLFPYAISLAHAAEYQVETPLSDPATEAHARAIFQQLRCMVCQSSSIADSPSEVAGDMREAVRQSVRQGMKEDDILAQMATRYGEFVLMRPLVKPHTGLLWGGPLIMLVLGGMVALRYFRPKKS